MNQDIERSKVPEVTLVFWIIKVLATTLGETGGDAVSMSMNLGYAVSSFIFIGIFAVAVVAQMAAKKFHPFLYWLVVIATTTAGTTMAAFCDSVACNAVYAPNIEPFYCVPPPFPQTLGTALGDWMADTNGLGYEGGALLFTVGLAVVGAAYYFNNISRTLLFWTAFILTRPLGATLGGFVDRTQS